MAVALRDPRVAAGRRLVIMSAGCAITMIVGVGLAIKAPSFGIPLPLAGFAVAIPLWLATTSRSGPALGVVVLYMGLVDGLVKLKSGSEIADLGRDVFIYAVVAGMVARARGPVKLPPLGGWILAWTIVVVVQLANPANGTALHSIVSLRQHLEFLPLFFVGFAALRSIGSLHAFFALLLTVAAINGVVGAYQATLSPEQLMAWGPGYAKLLDGPSPRTSEGPDGKKRVRPPGLGSDMGFAGVLGATAIPGGIALLLAYRRRRWLLALVVLGIIGSVVGVITSQSRSALITAIVVMLAMLFLIAVGGQAKRSLIGLCLVGAVAAIAVMAISSYDTGVFYRYRSITPNKAASTTYESRAGTWAAIPDYMRQIPLGAGIGSVGPAGGLWDTRPVVWNAESQFTFLVVEVGIPGLLVFLAFQAALCSAILSGLRRELDARTVVLLAAVAAPLFGYAANWLIGIDTTSTPNAAYLWLATGVISYWLIARPGSAPDRVPCA
jgi:hypothetical protein